jgi:hypothetical protein
MNAAIRSWKLSFSKNASVRNKLIFRENNRIACRPSFYVFFGLFDCSAAGIRRSRLRNLAFAAAAARISRRNARGLC